MKWKGVKFSSLAQRPFWMEFARPPASLLDRPQRHLQPWVQNKWLSKTKWFKNFFWGGQELLTCPGIGFAKVQLEQAYCSRKEKEKMKPKGCVRCMCHIDRVILLVFDLSTTTLSCGWTFPFWLLNVHFFFFIIIIGLFSLILLIFELCHWRLLRTCQAQSWQHPRQTKHSSNNNIAKTNKKLSVDVCINEWEEVYTNTNWQQQFWWYDQLINNIFQKQSL